MISQDMLSMDPIDRPPPDRVHDVCIELSEEVGGASLRRYARSNVPQLIEVQRQKMKGASLLPSADLLMTGDHDPSILTAGKSATLPKGTNLPPVFDLSWWGQVALAAAMALSLWWFVTG